MFIFLFQFTILLRTIVHVGTDIIDEDPDRDRALGLLNLKRNDGDLGAGIVRETETRDDIESVGVVRETGIEKGMIEENVPNEIGIAIENGNPKKRFRYHNLKQLFSIPFPLWSQKPKMFLRQ